MKTTLLRILQFLWLDRPVRQRGTLILAIPLACLFASVITIAGLRSKTIEVREQLDKHKQVIQQTNHLLKTLVDAETGVRGYGLTNHLEFLQPYLTAKASLPDTLKQLKEQVKNNPLQLQRLLKIQRNTQQQIRFLENTLKTIELLGVPGKYAQLTELLIRGKVKMDALRQEIDEFIDTQEELQSQLELQTKQWAELTNGVQLVALLVGLLGGAATWSLFSLLERELRNRETSLQESKTRIQAVVDNAAEGIITLDEQGNIESFNRAAQRIFGYEPSQIIGKNIRKLIAEPLREDTTGDALGYFLAHPTAKLEICQRETIGRRQDYKTFLMDLAVSKMQLANQHLFIGIFRDITERKQAEDTLRKQAQLLDLANDTIAVQDLNGTISYWNQGARRLYGWNQSEAIGKNIHQLLKTEFPQPLEEIKKVCVREGAWEGELVHTKQDGTKVTVATRWTLQRDPKGKPLAILQINNDISDRKRTEQALRESQQRLQLVMDNIPQFIYWKDRDLIFRGCNQNFANLLGFNTPTEIIGLTDYDLPIGIEQAQRYRASDAFVIQENVPKYHLRESLLLPNSQIPAVWFDVNKVPLTDGSGNVVGILSTFEDITERQRAEIALAESEQRFRATFEQAAVGMAQTNLEGQLLLVNQKLCDILGYSREELLTKNFKEITHPEDLAIELLHLSQLLTAEIETYSMEKRYLCKNGELVWSNLTVYLLRQPNGQPSLMGVVEDIRERKRAEEILRTRAEELAWTTRMLTETTAVLRKRNHELDQFAYVVSHDLKAPLRAIANLSSWIEEDLTDSLTDETRHQMNLLRGRVHRM
ncbi:MAG: PAS domain S-box protein, partial [Actinomycetota bacterium]